MDLETLCPIFMSKFKERDSMKYLLILLQLLSVSALAGVQNIQEQKIHNLLEKMTLEEKIGQLSQPVLREQDDTLFSALRSGRVGSFCVINKEICTPEERNRLQRIAVEESRLGIPLIFGFDVIHGFTTIFPTALGTSASWDVAMAEKAAHVAATEARHYGMNLAFSPMVDVSRDPRWGRISECYGEDVLMNAQFGAAVVKGYAGDDLTKPDSIGACVKHFVGYGLSQGGRDKQFTELSRRSLLTTYLPPFEACIKAGAVSVMTGFNDQSGVPSTANHFTLTETLKNQWGFDGFVVSDWDAVVELMNHGISGSDKESAEKAILAGTDVEMRSDTYWGLLESVREGRVAQSVIDESVARVLRIKFRLGLFDNPYIDVKKALAVQMTPEHRAVARQAAAESMVLLKNNGILPLKSSKKQISVIGPFAQNTDVYGWWAGHGEPTNAVTAFDGLLANKPAGIQMIGGTRARAFSPITIVCVGESGNTFGESHNLTDITLPQSQVELIKEAKASGSKVVAVVFNGRPLVLTPIMEQADAVLLAWHPGTEAGNALADVLFGKINPSGKLSVTLPKATGQIPLYYSDRRSGRPRQNRYLDMDAKPLFPFGFGLSYTTFDYANLRLSAPGMTKDGSMEIAVDVTNSGKVDGKEVVQLYVHDQVAGVTRPIKELKDFSKIMIKSGETKTVRFTLTAEQLAFYNIECEKVVEPGMFDLWVGGSSEDHLHTEFQIFD